MIRPAGAICAACAVFSTSVAAEALALAPKDRANIDRLVDKALADDRAYSILESLTTEVGPRLAASEAEARARDWGANKMKEMGFKNVRIETFKMPAWSRVSESAAIVSPFPQPLRATALGNSISTPEGGIEAEVVRFETLTDLQQAPLRGLEGKIVFVDEKMARTQDGSGYGVAVAKRSEATYEAAKRGAVAAVIRSVGTDSHRNPHTGMMRIKEGEAAVPAAALSNPDADQLARALAMAKGPVVMALNLQTAKIEDAASGNVVGEIPGRTDEIIVIGGHLDSWDLGTGAVDDGAGIAITLAAAKLIDEMKGKPGRTIRVVMWGAEEVGIHGAKAYAAAHKDELYRHALAAESDFGAGKVWSLQTKFAESALSKAQLFAEALRPLGVGPGDNEASGGPDAGPLSEAGVPVLDLVQDGTDYFDLHHTPDDTLDKVDPDAIRQNVAAWAAMLYLASETPGGFRDDAASAAAP
ncbi:MAG: M20/M25/M40 family metallo-hydrolase [Pseudomonadota bacterium]